MNKQANNDYTDGWVSNNTRAVNPQVPGKPAIITLMSRLASNIYNATGEGSKKNKTKTQLHR